VFATKDRNRGLLTTTGQETTTNSDGKFHIEVETGTYVLVSGVFSMPLDKLVWCKAIKAEGSELALSLNQQTALTGNRMGNTPYAPLEHKILDEIVTQIEP